MLCTEAALESGSYSKYFSVCLFFSVCLSAVSNIRLEPTIFTLWHGTLCIKFGAGENKTLKFLLSWGTPDF